MPILIIHLIFTFLCSLFVKNKLYDKESILFRFLYDTWIFIIIKVMRIKIIVNGIEKVPKDSKILFVGNHLSNFDSIITGRVFKKYKISFISKASNFKIPIFGKIVRRCCFLEIDRDNSRNALKTIVSASNLLKKENISIGVYPEGTRNKTNEVLLHFHDGVFKIAQRANAQIVVLAIKGSNLIHKNYPLKKSIVELNVVDIIDSNKVETLSTHEISERVKEKLKNELIMEA